VLLTSALRRSACLSLVAVSGLAGVACGSDDSNVEARPQFERPPSGKDPALDVGYWKAVRLAALDDVKGNDDQTNEGRITEVVNDVQLSLAAGVPSGVCSELTRREQLRLGLAWAGSPPVDKAGERGCKDAVYAVAGHRKKGKIETQISQVVEVDVAADGRHAVAHLENADGSTHTARFLEERLYGWNLDDFGGVDPDAEQLIRAEGDG
jgi:hypothetical protein